MAKFNIDKLKHELGLRGMDTDTPNGIIITSIKVNPSNHKQLSIEASVPGRRGDMLKEIGVKTADVNRGNIPDAMLVTILNRLAN